jgi:hypothetical protein
VGLEFSCFLFLHGGDPWLWVLGMGWDEASYLDCLCSGRVGDRKSEGIRCDQQLGERDLWLLLISDFINCALGSMTGSERSTDGFLGE